MQSLPHLLSRYEGYHTKRITKVTHSIGIPFLIFAILIFLGWIHLSMPNLFEISTAWIALAALLIYYYFLDTLLAAGVMVFLVLLALIAELFSQPVITGLGVMVFLAALVIGCTLQYIGHRYEKKKPAFMDGIELVLIAPLYLFAQLMFALGYRKDLQNKMKK